MDYSQIESLRRNSSAWRLLRADNAALIVSFLSRVFVEDNVRGIPAQQLIDRLDDQLYALNEMLGDEAFPKSAKAYLEDWAKPENGWLRKYYPPSSDEAHFDAMPAAEKAIAWISGLGERSFIGTESRLQTAVELLRQIVFGAETDPAARLSQLKAQRAQLDEQIERAQAGEFEILDSAGRRDRYQQFASTARELLSDFREVEANFRNLDRELRERIAVWDGSKGELLDDVLGSRSSITDSDQGRSFQAFYDFLLSAQRQEELGELLARVHDLDGVSADPRNRHIHHDWLDAGEQTQATVRLLSEQLRRFLDDKAWLENRRVMEVLRRVESQALRLRRAGRVKVTHQIDEVHAIPSLPLERPMYVPVAKAHVDSAVPDADQLDGFEAAVLFEQLYVDSEQLAATVRTALRQSGQVALADLIDEQPLDKGLAQLIGYLALNEADFHVAFDESNLVEIGWRDDELERVATMPGVTYARAVSRVAAQEQGGLR